MMLVRMVTKFQKQLVILQNNTIRAGVVLLEPKMVFPFPKNSLKKAVERGTKKFLCVELSAGQMIEDVKLAIECQRPVELCNRMGGNLLTCDDVCAAVRNMMKEM